MWPPEIILSLKEIGVGPKTFQLLIGRFQSSVDLYTASVEEVALLPRIGRAKAEAILRTEDRITEARAAIEKMVEEGIRIMTWFDTGYPASLRTIDDPPPLLFIKGNLLPNDDRAVAVVGTHRASERGIRTAEEIGRWLGATGVTVASGLAVGIDGAGHRGAIDGGGRTLAFLGGGFHRIQPVEHLPLAGAIVGHGALFSEYPPEVPVTVGGLMARNRLVTGVSRAVIVIEALINSSGTMDAIARAKAQGRPVCLVRGIGDAEVAKRLIGQGVRPIDGPEELENLLT